MRLWTHRFLQILPLLALFTFAATTNVRAADDERGPSVGIVVVPDGLAAKDVKAAVVNAFTNRGWAIRDSSNDEVVGYIRKRSNEARVTVIFDSKQAEFFCAGYVINKTTGERVRPEIPDGWIRNLKADTTKGLNQRIGMR